LAHIAAYKGHVAVLRVLHELGADLNQGNNNGATPAYIAVQMGHEKTLRVLHELGADLSKARHDVGPPVFLAAQQGHVQLVRLLISYGVDCALCLKKTKAELMEFARKRGELIEQSMSAFLKQKQVLEDNALVSVSPEEIAGIMGHDDIAQMLAAARAAKANLPAAEGSVVSVGLFSKGLLGHEDAMEEGVEVALGAPNGQ
jgi:ankyrin repeat protein